MLSRKSAPHQSATSDSEAAPPLLDLERPTLESIAPDWVEMRQRHAAMHARCDEIEAELLRITPIVCRAGLHATNQPGIGYTPLPAPPPAAPNPKVVSLLGRFLPAKKEPVPEQERVLDADHPVALKRRAHELADELDALREAIKLILPTMERARLIGSVELCRRLSPEYQIIADRVCHAMLELGQAAAEHEAWLKDLRRQGASYSTLRPVLVQGPDEFGDPIARLRRLLEWAAEGGGWFDPAEIPAEWRKRQ